MKKLAAVIFCVIMILSLAACGLDEAGGMQIMEDNILVQEATPEQKDVQIPVGEPTEEEQEALRQYYEIVSNLNKHAEGKFFKFDHYTFGIESKSSYVDGQEALRLFYEYLTELDEVDKWVGSEWAADESINWDRQAVLDSFLVVEDVLLNETKTYRDFLGNEAKDPQEIVRHYDVDGKLIDADPYYFEYTSDDPWYQGTFSEQIASNLGWIAHSLHYVYNTEGVLEKIEYISYDDLVAVRTFSYDGGAVSSEQLNYANGDSGNITYQYDEKGQVVQIEYADTEDSGARKYVYSYTYDHQGKVMTENIAYYEWDSYDEMFDLEREFCTTYTYDEKGALQSGVHKCMETWVGKEVETTDTFAYTCDEQGRPVAVKVTCGDRIYIETGEVATESKYPTCEVEIEYGDYYFYAPAMG